MFVSEGSKVTLPSCGFSKTNYIFKGWNTKADGTGESYKPNATLTTIPSKLYAQWAKTSYKVNLVYTGGTIKINGVNHTNNYTMTCTFKNASTTYSLPTTSQVMRPGYKFVAWYDNEECTGKILTKITIDNVSDMTLYAKWRVDQIIATSGTKEELQKSLAVRKKEKFSTPVLSVKGLRSKL